MSHPRPDDVVLRKTWTRSEFQVPTSSALRVIIDLSAFCPGKAFGAQTFIDGILRGIVGRREIQIIAICNRRTSGYLASLCPTVHLAPVQAPSTTWKRVLWSWVRLPRII